jgi:hypothetical protein
MATPSTCTINLPTIAITADSAIMEGSTARPDDPGTSYFTFTITNNDSLKLVNLTVYFKLLDSSGNEVKTDDNTFYCIVPNSQSVDYIDGGGSWQGSVMLHISALNLPFAGTLKGRVFFDVERTDSYSGTGSLPLNPRRSED